MERWLKRRIPDNRIFQLDMSNIFIFPSRFGLLFLLLCACLFLLGSNYNNNLMLLLCYFLVALFLVCLSASFSNFAKIRLQIGKTHPIFAGDDLNVPIWLNSANQQADDDLPFYGKLHFRFWRQKLNCSVDPQHLTNPVNLNLSTHKRGWIEIPRITIECFYPLGLYRCWTHVKFPVEVLVYPRPLPCAIKVEEQVTGNSETETVSNVSGSDNFDALRSYQVGEPLYHVAWKQVAKNQAMVSKQFTSNQQSAVYLSLAKLPPQDIEKSLSQLCFMVLELSREHRKFGLDLGSVSIPPDEGIAHKEQCLKALALYGRHY